MRIAIPTNEPGGLEADRSDHFGHCDVFTIIDLDEKSEVVSVETIPQVEHDAGGCMAPIKVLEAAKVEAIIVAGMGARPMQGFNEVGITVYFADRIQVPSVPKILEFLKTNSFPKMHADQACKGSHNCH
jgi:predicted Fe-Mo cluster-binding NifX family protein